MKKFIVIMIMLMSFMTSFATDNKVEVFEHKDDVKIEWVRDSVSSEISYLDRNWGWETPQMILDFKIGSEVISFDVYKKVVVDDKIYIVGRGKKYGINYICIDEKNIYIPMPRNKKMKINSKKIATKIFRETEFIPANYEICAI